MKIRTKEQWRKLIAEHEASNLKAIEFCKEHAICPNYFSKRKKQLSTESKSVKSTAFVTVNHSIPATPPQLELQHQQIRIKISLTVHASWLADFIHQLQA